MSAIVAGMLVVIIPLAVVAGPFGFLFGLFISIAGAIPAAKVAAVPAALIGGALWQAGATRAWARRRRLWAGTGALVGLGSLAVANALSDADLDSLVHFMPFGIAGLAPVFAIAGALAALAFRGCMKLLLLFVRPEGAP